MKKRGVGISCEWHPSGMPGGTDPSQAQIRLKIDGTFDLIVGAVELGQGSKTALTQIAADALGVPYENITHRNDDTDIAGLSMGSFASRVTYIDGNAIIRAAEDLKEKMKGVAAGMLEVQVDELEVGDNKVFVKTDPEKAVAMGDLGPAANFGAGYLVGLGFYAPPGPGVGMVEDPETGKMSKVATIAFGTCVAEVEVDTETGEVSVEKFVHVVDVGKAINPRIVNSQISGGMSIGLSFALTENVYPYYPDNMDLAPASLADYPIPTMADMPRENIQGIVEVPAPNGPFGAKGFSEMSTNGPPSAILTAIHDAIGVWIVDYPATPERILRALEEKK